MAVTFLDLVVKLFGCGVEMGFVVGWNDFVGGDTDVFFVGGDTWKFYW